MYVFYLDDVGVDNKQFDVGFTLRKNTCNIRVNAIIFAIQHHKDPHVFVL
jgi:hypothetical protein